MRAQAVAVPTKRSSSRVAVVSKAMRRVDDDTRREVRNKRLLALEADNYNEKGGAGGGVDDDAYEDEDENEDKASGKSAWKLKKAKVPNHALPFPLTLPSKPYVSDR